MRKLEWAEIGRCARGHICATSYDEGTVFSRFTPEAQSWYDQREGWQIRTRCPAGVVLDFRTDSTTVYLRATVHKGARKACWFDLFSDGVMAGTLGSDDPGEVIEGELPCGNERKKRRIQIYLPHNRPVGVQVALADGASFDSSAPRSSIHFLGDSITQGMDANHPGLCFPMVTARRMDMELFNEGVGGAIFAKESLPKPPWNHHRIVVAYGTNDWNGGRSLDEAHAYLVRLREHWPSTPVAVLEPLWRTAADGEGQKNANGQTLEDYRAGLREIVARFDGMRCIRYDALLPPGPAFLFDGTHPNEAGHVVYGENLARLLRAE